MKALSLDTKIDGLTIGFMLSHKMIKLVLKMIKNDNRLLLSNDIEDIIETLNNPLLKEIISINNERKNISDNIKTKEIYSSSEDLRLNNYNNRYVSAVLNPGMRYGF